MVSVSEMESGAFFRKVALVQYSVVGTVRRADLDGMAYPALKRANFRCRLFKKGRNCVSKMV
jgi:hypothetical protein